jgi:hypothetical protein
MTFVFFSEIKYCTFNFRLTNNPWQAKEKPKQMQAWNFMKIKEWKIYQKEKKSVGVESEGLKHFQFAFHVWKLEYSYRKQIEETSWNLCTLLISLGIYSYYISCSYKFMKAFLMLD